MNDLAVIQYNVTDAAISQMEAQYLPLKINGIEDKAGFVAVHEARMVVKSHRVAVEKKRKELNSDALAWQRKVNEEAKRITGKLDPIEAHLEKEENAVVEEKNRIKAEAERKEMERVRAIRARVTEMQNLLVSLHGKQIDELNKIRDILLDCTTPQEIFMEFTPEASAIREKTLEVIEKAIEDRKRLDAEQAAAKAEAERLAKEREAQEAERKRLADEKAAIEAEKAAIEYAKKAEQARQEREALEKKLAEEARIKAEADAKAKIEAEAKAAAEKAQRETEEAARKETLRPDKEKIINFVSAVFKVPRPDFQTDEAKQVFMSAIDSLSRWGKKLTKQAEAL